MTNVGFSDQELTAHFVFPDDFIGFQGHFPAKKMLPGVCQIQCITCILEQWKSTSVALKEVVYAKFFTPVFPLEELTCECRDIHYTNEEFTVKAFIRKGTQKVAEMKLRVSFRDKKKKHETSEKEILF
jgi:3-hydroxyacyl-[acyl-carrier-protein] dehydratase